MKARQRSSCLLGFFGLLAIFGARFPSLRCAEVQSQRLDPNATESVPSLQVENEEEKCPLEFSEEIHGAVSAACGKLNRESCCPVLAAWFYAARAQSALRTLTLPVSDDSPVLPDDSAACVDAFESALARRGVKLPRPNATCDAVECFCGIRFHRLTSRTCAQAFNITSVSNRREYSSSKSVCDLERNCRIPTDAGCSSCLQSLHQLNGVEEMNTADDRTNRLSSRNCELMGLTWLLARNRSTYIATAVAVFRTIMYSSVSSNTQTCVATDRQRMPLPVDSSQLGQVEASVSSATVNVRARISWGLAITLSVISHLFSIKRCPILRSAVASNIP